MSKFTASDQLMRHVLIWVICAQGLCLLPLLWFMPVWLPFLWVAVVVWRLKIFSGAWPFPSAFIKFTLAGASVVALVFSFDSVRGVEPLVAFLAISFVIKLVEMRRRSDVITVIFTAFFTISSQFLFFQNVLSMLYALFCCLVILGTWVGAYCSREIPAKRQLRTASTLVWQSIPLMVVMFVVLPRFGAFWQVPIPGGNDANTGFSDKMKPGAFSELIQSNKTAFRIRFFPDKDGNDTLPPPQDRYWRGLVMDEFDGEEWQFAQDYARDRANNARSAPSFWRLEIPKDAQPVRYEVLLEPHYYHWLFTLMAPVNVESRQLDVKFEQQFLTFSRRPVTSKVRYEVTSYLKYSAQRDGLNQRERQRNLRLPSERNNKTLAMAQLWRQQEGSDEAYITRVLAMYQKSFVYTLQPPLLGKDSVDDFLFSTQQGFCEHFASSFTTLMRAAGIPARVVVGYQGGEYVPNESYLLVRQSDAHAWTEVWLAGKGWQRVDPTAAVAPSRIRQGLSASLGESDRGMVRGGFGEHWFSHWQMQLDAWNFNWQRWVLSYDTERQLAFLRGLLGGTEAWRIGAFLVFATSAILLFVFLLQIRPMRRKPVSQEVRLYQRIVKILARLEYYPEVGEAPAAFLVRVAEQEAQASYLLAKQLGVLAEQFNQYVYGGAMNDALVLSSLKAVEKQAFSKKR